MKRTSTRNRKATITFVALLSFFMAAAIAATAGNKNIKAEIISPAAGTEINSSKPFTVTVKLTNNDMAALDMMMDMPTIVLQVDGKTVATDTFMLTANVPGNGGTVTLTTDPHSVTFTGSKTSAPLCVNAGLMFYTNTSPNANPCGNVALKEFPTSVATINNDAAISVYPNPATDKLTLSTTTAINGNIVIMDLTGKVVKQSQLNGTTNTIQVADLNSGIYLYHIATTDGQSYNGRVAIN